MTDGHPSSTREEPGLDEVLLDAKLSVPPFRTGLVSRVTLIDRVRTSGAVAVGVTAPAGYGKSTLLVEWARSERRRVAWLSLDQLDDDPGAVLFLLVRGSRKATA